MKSKLLITLIALATCAALSAAPVAITRAQASELYVVLSQAEAGFSPANTIAAADNLNVLRPVVEALDKGKTAAQRQIRALPAGDDRDARISAIIDALEAKADEAITLDLSPLTLADEELTAAKLKPAQLAVIRRWLKK